MKSNLSPISRRDILKIAARAALGLSGVLGFSYIMRYLTYKYIPLPPQRYEVGQAGDFPPGTRTVVASVPAMLVHDETGYHAISLVCTHLGCTVGVKDTEMVCPCHGSRYDLGGKVLNGPSTRELPLLEVEVGRNGVLTVVVPAK